MDQYLVWGVGIAAGFTICVILAIYISVLKKNGWLGSGSSEFYRCPNQRCKRIFQKPIELKDLAETPARVYPACPHCGMDLGSLLGSGVEKKFGLKVKASVQQNKPGMRIEDSVSRVETRRPEFVERAGGSGGKFLKPAQAESSRIVAENREKLVKVDETARPTAVFREEPDAVLKTPQESYSPQKTLKEAASDTKAEVTDARPEGCIHFFGYLRCLPKGSLVPYGCYSCDRMVDCYKKERNGTGDVQVTVDSENLITHEDERV